MLVKPSIAVILSILLGPHATFGQEALRVDTTSAPPLANDEQTGFHDQLTKAAFKRIGREVSIVWLPASAKLASFLLRLSEHAEQREHDPENIYTPMSRSEIADYLGLTPRDDSQNHWPVEGSRPN